ncbi:MAG: hypothetical protein EPO68_13435 [Planctomycetota bacterium]|nr:MAG: hypothetical protein EPO68_13435 [Planctomycetota bacterium]
MDFLLECIGFPPDSDLAELGARVERDGESVAWRDPDGLHRRLQLAEGLELRLDRDEEQSAPALWPYFQSPHRLRVALESLERVPDQPYDALLRGDANPAPPTHPELAGESWPLACYLTDARRFDRPLPARHVIAVSIAGFALDVAWIGADRDAPTAGALARPHGALLHPLGRAQDPGGCMDLSLRIDAVRHLSNPLTGLAFDLLECDAPGRPLQLFVSRWQLEEDELPAPRPGMRIDGVFVFTGRVAGGLPATRVARAHFG